MDLLIHIETIETHTACVPMIADKDLKTATLGELRTLATVLTYLDKRGSDIANHIHTPDVAMHLTKNLADIMCRYLQIGGDRQIAEDLIPDNLFTKEEKLALLNDLSSAFSKEDKNENNN